MQEPTEFRPLGELYAAILQGPTLEERIVFARIAERIYRERGIGPRDLLVANRGSFASQVCPSCHRAWDRSQE